MGGENGLNPIHKIFRFQLPPDVSSSDDSGMETILASALPSCSLPDISFYQL